MPKLLFALVAAAVSASVGAAPVNARDTYPRQAGIDAEHYVFALTLSDSTDEIVGETTASIRFTRDGLTAFFLDLTSANNGKGMTVTSVTADSAKGAPLRFAHSANHVNITLDHPTKTGEVRRVTVHYHGVPLDGLRVGTNKYNERCFFSWNWPNHARDWLATIDHPSDKATSEFVVTAPQKYSVVANGLMQSEVTLGDGRKTTHWKQSVPIASWLNAIGVEQFAVHHGGMVRGVELQTWVAHQELEAGIERFEPTARRSIEFYSDYIGPYAYEKMASVTAPFNGGATEHASEVFYGDGGTWTGAPVRNTPPGGRAGAAGGGRAGAAGGGRGGAAAGGRAGGAGRGANTPSASGPGGAPGGTIAHEIAHQWFGDAVTEADWDDAWLSEGFATYFALLYDEHYLGHDQFINGVRSMFQRTGTVVAQSHQAVIHTNIVEPALNGVIGQQVYQKGGSVLHMLRGQVGTENFWKAIRSYYKHHMNGSASTDDLRHEFEEASGQDLQWFFTQWLHGTSDPALEGTWSYDATAKKIAIDLAQTQGGDPFRIPLEIGIRSGTDTNLHIEKVELRQAKQHFEIAADAAPTELVLDPNTWILMDAPKFTKR